MENVKKYQFDVIALLAIQILAFFTFKQVIPLSIYLILSLGIAIYFGFYKLVFNKQTWNKLMELSIHLFISSTIILSYVVMQVGLNYGIKIILLTYTVVTLAFIFITMKHKEKRNSLLMLINLFFIALIRFV